VSDDGASAIVIIALVGNPFSPAYARARDRGPANPLTYSSMNVALYGTSSSAWALHERPIGEGARTATSVTIGASTMAWQGDRLVVDIDERATPFGRPVRGRVVVHPQAHAGLELAIDERGEHLWWPVAPLARIEVDLKDPAVRFEGHGYHDANAGQVALDRTFESWSWSRARTEDGALLTYDVSCSSGVERSLAFNVSPRGHVEHLELPWRAPLKSTVWGLERHARGDAGEAARVVRSLEDGPFYARALIETRLAGRPVVAMHEALAAHRLRRPWVRLLTGARMRTTSA
jgi:carotenoid 1,2-hydratase